jgi:hypothetical protein
MPTMSVLKYVAAALCSGAWVYGLIGQLESFASTAKYLVISALMVALSLL